MKETVENRIDIYVPDDLEKATSGARESIYYLESLSTLFREHVVLPQNHNPELHKERLKRINDCYTDFDKLEEKVYRPEGSEVLPDGTHRLLIDLIELTEICVEYVKLKERIDELQVEILKYLFDVENSLIRALIPEERYLDNLKMSYSAKMLTYSAFEHSKDEDRLDNYRFYINHKKEAKKYSKKNEHPIRLKVRNYDYVLKKFRNMYKMTKNSQIQLLSDSSRLREEQEVKEINNEQFSINKKVEKLTIIATVLGIIGFIYASISTYYLVTDDTKENQETHYQQVEQTLNNIEIELEKIKNQNGIKDSILNEIKELKLEQKKK